MKTLFILAMATTVAAQAAEPCRWIRGRAHYYYGDGQFRLWHIGTRHEFNLQSEDGPEVDQKMPTLEDKILTLLRTNVKDPTDISNNDLFGDFLVCPAEAYVKGSAQWATLKGVRHEHLVASPAAASK